MLGGDPLRRRALQRGPGLRPRARRAPDVAQGLPPRRRRAARARLLAGRVHAPLLRRVPRAARDDRPRRAARAALVAARHPRPGARRPRVHARAGRSPAARAGRRARRSTTAAARRSPSSARAPTRCRRRCSARCRSRAAASAGPGPKLKRRAGGPRPQPLRRRRPRAPRRTGSAAAAVPGDGRPRAPAPRVRHPDLRRRLRRALHRSSSSSSASSGWATSARSGCTTCSAPGTAAGPPYLRREIVRVASRPSRPRCSASSTSGTAPTSSSPPAGRRSSPRSRSRAAGRAPTWSTTTSPSSSPPPSSASGRSARTGSGLYGIAGSPWLRDLYVDRYGGAGRDVPVRRGRDRLPPAARRPAGATPSSPTRARSRRGARSSSRCSASRSCAGAGRTSGSSCSASSTPLDRAVRTTRTPASPATRSWPWLFSEATAGLCLSLTNYSLMPREMLACGLPCVELDRPSTRSVFGDGRAGDARRLRPGAIADALERLLDDEHEWERRSRRGSRSCTATRWDAAAEQVERELRNALAGCAVAERRPHAALGALMAVEPAAGRHLGGGRCRRSRRPTSSRTSPTCRRSASASRCRATPARPVFSTQLTRGHRRPSTPTRWPRRCEVKPEWSDRAERDVGGDAGATRRATTAAARARRRPTRRPPTPGRRSATLAASGGTLFDELLGARLMSALWLPITVLAHVAARRRDPRPAAAAADRGRRRARAGADGRVHDRRP